MSSNEDGYGSMLSLADGAAAIAMVIVAAMIAACLPDVSSPLSHAGESAHTEAALAST